MAIDLLVGILFAKKILVSRVEFGDRKILPGRTAFGIEQRLKTSEIFLHPSFKHFINVIVI
jgi:hypothetical protein